MRPSKASILTLMCLAFLSMQISGLHGHISVGDGHAGEHQNTHLHDADANGHETGHDVDEEIDVPLDIRTVWVKSMPFLLLMVFGLLIASAPIRTIWLRTPDQLKARRRTRWRPPLRAPPLRTHNII